MMARLTQRSRVAAVAVAVVVLGAIGVMVLASGGNGKVPHTQPEVGAGSATPSPTDPSDPSSPSTSAEEASRPTGDAPSTPIAVSASVSAGKATSSGSPTAKPAPSATSGATPGSKPSATPSSKPSAKPSAKPGAKPGATPSSKPTGGGLSTAPTTTGFPNSSNTGVPARTALTPYTGPLTITKRDTVIDSKTVNGALLIRAANVIIKNSQVNGRVNSDGAGAVTIVDSKIDGGSQETFPSVSYSNLTLQRVEVIGGQHSVQCSDSCTVVDSWLHGQYIPHTSAGHVNAFISNGGSGMVVRHNSLSCDVQPTTQGTGCTADLSLFGDFDPIENVVIDNNLFLANSTGASYCLYAGYSPSKRYAIPAGVVVTNNVFQRGSNNKCGIYGPVTAFRAATGSAWTGNVWQDTLSAVSP